MKKNNTAEKALFEAEKITEALKKGTEKTLKNIVSEAINSMIADEDDEDKVEPIEDDSLKSVEDEETDDVPEVTDVDDESDEDEEEGSTEYDTPGKEDELSDMEEFKVSDDEFDISGVEGDEVLKLISQLDDDDQIIVKKDEDGTFDVKSSESQLDTDDELFDDDEDSDALEDDDKELDIDIEDDDVNDKELDIDIEDDDVDDEDNIELELDSDDDDDVDELNEENLGYTDSYQKDVFAKKPNMKLTSKNTIDVNDGLPLGSERPWAKSCEGKPFCKSINEADSISTQAARKMVKTKHKQHRPNTPEEVLKVDSPLSETVKKIVNKAKEIQAENKQYKQAINGIKKALYEAAVLNVNYGKVVSLLVNESATKEEKNSIVERFNNVKTIKEGNELYNTIKKELTEIKKGSTIIERAISVGASNTINETTIYNTKDNPSLNLMERMESLYKKRK